MNDGADAGTTAGDESGTDGDTATASDGNDADSAGEERAWTATPESESSADGALADEPVGERRGLDGNVRIQWLVGRLVASVISAVVVAGFYVVAGPRLGVPAGEPVVAGVGRNAVTAGLVAFGVFFAVAVVWVLLLYRSWRYEVREDSLYLTRGVLTRVQTVAPYVRVQHVDSRRSPVERLLGLSSLVVYTAGSRGADVTIPGLTDERASELQARLKRLAIESEEEDAV